MIAYKQSIIYHIATLQYKKILKKMEKVIDRLSNIVYNTYYKERIDYIEKIH